MHTGESAENSKVLHLDMAGERRIVGHDHAVADLTVMGDMHARHEEAVIADSRGAAAMGGAGMHGDMLADLVVAADDQIRLLAPIFQILGPMAEAGEGKDAAAFAERRPSGDHHMGFQPAAASDAHPGVDLAERADMDVVQFRFRVDDRRGVDFGHAVLTIP